MTTTSSSGDLSALSVWPLIGCKDARGLAAFLVDALGFEQIAVAERDGVVTRAELRWPRGVGGVVLREPHPAYPDEPEFRAALAATGPCALYLVADSVEAVHRRAQGAGADIIRSFRNPTEDVQAFAMRDPEGNVWSIADLTLGSSSP